MRTLLSLSLAMTLTVGFAQTTPPPAGQTPAPAAPQKPEPPKSDLKPYAEIVTKDFVTQQGVFKVHRNEDKEKVLWEVPEKLLGRVFLWQTEISELPLPSGMQSLGMGMGTRTLRFERRKNKIFLRDVRLAMRTPEGDGLADALRGANVEPIIRAFDVMTEGDGKSVVIDVTSLFLTDPPEFQVKGAFGGGGVDPGRSYIQRTKAFPENIETRSVLTFVGGGAPAGGGRGGGGGGGTSTTTVHYSLVLLPEKPMAARLKDSRIGYFNAGFDLIRTDGPLKRVEYINRFRLEKKDPTAAVSEPVKPITYYLAREVPDKWRPFLKAGVEAWQAAFEKAGFKNAIICKDAPSVKEDPTWDAEDARYSVIRWTPSSTANAMGPSIQDPRSAETLSAHVIFWHNIIDLVQKWYFVQCGATDPRAARLPLSDDMVGHMMQYVTTHEVGHTLGLEHNFEASASRTISQLRNPDFMKTHGVSSSIMSYSRNNYVTQPGDGVVGSDNGFLGEYDYFAIEYGYKPIAGAFTPEQEKPALDTLLARQVNDPTVRFGNYRYNEDPTTQSERIGDDTIEATRLGLLNLDRLGRDILLPATTKFGEDYTVLGEVYDDMTMHRLMWVLQVMKEVGGVVEHDTHAGRGGDVFRPVPREKQLRALRFLANTGMAMPAGMLNPNVMRRLFPAGDLGRISMVQLMIMNQLLAEARLQRIQDQHVALGKDALSVRDVIVELQAGAWKELGTNTPTISLSRRMLQQSYLETMDNKLNGISVPKGDFVLVAKAALKNLVAQIDGAYLRSADPMTKAHLAESRSSIKRILAGKPVNTAGGGLPTIFDLFGIKEPSKEQVEAVRHGGLCFSKEAMLIEIASRLDK